MELGEPRTGGSTSPSSSRYVAILVGLVCVLVLGIWMLGWLQEKPASPYEDVLAGLDGLGEIDRLKEELGGPAEEMPTPRGLNLDAPIELGDLRDAPAPSRSPWPTTAPSSQPPAATSPPASAAPPRDASGLGREARTVDAEALVAARDAGDFQTLLSTLRDRTVDDGGRVLAMSLAVGSADPRVQDALTELFESGAEPFPLRESAAYALLERQGEVFGRYLVRVAQRPGVASAQDGDLARLVVLTFYADQILRDGGVLGSVAPDLMTAARAGNRTAAQALSFAIRTGSGPETEAVLRDSAEVPVVSENLLRFYRRMVEDGKDEYRQRLSALEARHVQGL